MHRSQRSGGRRLARLRVGGPRQSALGPIARYRGKLRFVLVRASRGGALPVGKNLAEAKGHVCTSLERVNGLWGACGIGFGATKTAEVVAVDPPPPYVVSFGCGLGDNLLTVTLIACDKPVVLAPAMNDRMWANPILKENLAKLA